jgi:putative oxidoreductase
MPRPDQALFERLTREDTGGLFLVLGFQTRLAGTALALFSLAAAAAFHSDFVDPNQMVHFFKNVMMAGGLLQIVAFGAGALSIDNRGAKGGEITANLSLAG